MKAQEKRNMLRHRHVRIRRRVAGTSERPRLCVKRTTKHLYAFLIDDDKGHTLASASTVEADMRNNAKRNTEGAAAIGHRIAEKAQALNVSGVVFDRGGFKYHGLVASLANAARESGLKF
jgi:large subunit ribosomal protein L18